VTAGPQIKETQSKKKKTGKRKKIEQINCGRRHSRDHQPYICTLKI